MFLFSVQCGCCALSKENINLYNLQKDNMYIINLESKAINVDVSDSEIIKILPVTSIYEDKKQLFIEALENGVCDVIVTTSDSNYKIRFVTGPVFQDNSNDILPLDIPSGIKR